MIMDNPLIPVSARVIKIVEETPDVKSFQVEFLDKEIGEKFDYLPGQCAQVSLVGVGESHFVINSTPTRRGPLQFSVKKAGKHTAALHEVEEGAVVGVRGPFGNSFPVDEMKGKNVLIVGGGIGLAPLRTLINYMLDQREEYGKITIVYGARTSKDLVYKEELNEWASNPGVDLHLTIDIEEEGWTKNVGVVPVVLEKIAPSPQNTIAVTCGPPIMIRFALQSLTKLGFQPEDIITTLEMRMKCGIGKCGRCNIGHIYVCQDGPVFTYAQLKSLPQEF